uniref:Altered inheritance of mitochondria protein 24, mitochondrial n=1 Tax=Panagrolaimus davidi TaxID=227884 RepID=A0A914PTZ3_9BILA
MNTFQPQQQQPQPQQQQIPNTVGQFNGGQYKIDHRDTNTLLSVMLQPGANFHAQPGAMVAMTPEVQLKGKSKFSLKKMFTGGEMAISTFTGPGEVLIAPPIWGDIIPLQLNGSNQWKVGRDNFLAFSDGVVKETKSQGLGKAMFSGEGLFIHHISGVGVFFIHSLGAIVERHLQPNEQWIVDNGHLVAWNCAYLIEKASSGGMMSNMLSGEGLVCRFTGPGTVYIQTRNPESLSTWIKGHAGTA